TPSSIFFVPLCLPRPPSSTLFPYTTLFRSLNCPLTFAPSASRQTSSLWIRCTPSSRGHFPSSVHVECGMCFFVTEMSLYFGPHRSEEHTSELQSRFDLVCRLLLDKKNNKHQ